MFKTVENVLKEVGQLSLQNELQKITELDIDSIVYQSLSSEEINQLAIKIGLLPVEYKNILFFKYCFKSTPFETNKTLNIENSMSKVRYTQKMLSDIMGLEDSWIDDKSMEEACRLALMEYVNDYDTIEITQKPDYSRTFRQKLKDIKIEKNPNNIIMLIARRVAVFILVCFLSISVVLTVNAEAREKVFDWIIERFPRFSIFIPESTGEIDNLIELTSLKINYIPMEFELIDINEGRSMIIYEYLSGDNKKLTIQFFDSSSGGKSYYETEDTEIEEIIFKESKAYIWESNGITYLIWHQDGIECHIVGNLKQNEIFKIAESVSK